MSIATFEAEEIYPYRWKKGKRPDYIEDESDIISEYLAVIPHIKSTDLQNTYVAGRTAEPTEAEIEAAAKAMYGELCGNIIHGCLDENGDPQMDEDPFRIVFINAAVEALSAARKAVTE